MRSLVRLAALAAIGCAAAGGCSSGGSNGIALLNGGPTDNTAPGTSHGSNGGGAGLVQPGGSASGLPPEMKTESDYLSPVATGEFVWTANPTSGRVAYIDAKSFTVQTVQAGNGPTYLAAVPSADGTSETAIVLNVRSHDATLLRHDPSAGVTTTQYPSTKDANSWAVSPLGRWAIAWTDATKVMNTDPTQGFQDLAVLDVNPPANAQALPPTILAAGYRPSQIVFSVDESRAYAVTQDGITVIDLSQSQPVVTQNFPLSPPVDLAAPDASASDSGTAEAGGLDAPSLDAISGGEGPTVEASLVDAGSEGGSTGTPDTSTMGAPSSPPTGPPDVSFTTDGAYALVRQDGVAAITVVSLKDGTPTRVDLPVAPTDLTVAPDGTFAVAVLRDLSSVALLPLPPTTSQPAPFSMVEIPGETIGRAIVAENLATKQASILLFTTVVAVDHLTVLTLQPTASYRTITLHAPVLAVFPTSDAQNVVVLHNVNGAPNSTARGAYSLVPIGNALPARIVSAPAPPTAVALAPSGDRALVAMSDQTATYQVDLAFFPSLDVALYPLASPPIAVGIAAAAGMGFVAQNYSDGRITFIDLASTDAGAARTITGFELSAQVFQGDAGP